MIEKDFLINPARAVAITGHRVIYPDFDIENLEITFYKLIEKGFNIFLVGMALGFDTICFQTLEKIRENKDIKIVACIPCLSQPEKFNSEQKKEYYRMVSVADKKVVLSNEYTSSCMQKRNQFMVDNSSLVLAYIKRDFGGTANTIRYAKKQNKNIVKIN